MKIHPVTLVFNKKQEKEYREVFFNDSLPVVRIALLCTGILYGVFGFLDHLVAEELFGFFMFIRLAVVVPFIALVTILSFTRFFVHIWQLLLFTAAIIGGVGISLMIAMAPDNGSYYGGLMLVLFAGYFFVRLRFFWASLAGWINLILFNILILSFPSVPKDLLVPYNFFYISANLIGMFASYYIELSSRNNFYLKQQLEEKQKELEHVNESLESVVDDRTHDLKASEERFRSLSEMLPVIVYETNLHGLVTFANQEALRQLGVTKKDLEEGVSLFDFITPEYHEKARRDFEISISQFGIIKGEYIARRKDGSLFPVMDYSNPITKNDQIIGSRGVVVDLSEHKANEKLRTEVAVTKQSAEFKQNFLANMSHEIRTPLTGIMGITEILASTSLDEKQKEHLGTLRQSTENLREIINQILDYSKIEAGKVLLRPEVFPTNTLFDNATKLFTTTIQKPVQLHTHVHKNMPPFLRADFMRIQQIINNLLSNAIKFTARGKINLKAQVDRWMSETRLLVKIEVQDTGIGIAEEKQSILFKPFSQIDHADTRSFEGTGLGLSICKDLANLLKGEIGVQSASGQGSLFWFTFEAQAADQPEMHSPSLRVSQEKDSGSLRILVVEDKIVNQKVIGLMLTSLGHTVTAANNGQHALEIFQPKHFDLILMDIQMPVMNGIAATHKLRQMYSDIPLIVGLSANAFEGDREKYMAQGMDDYLTKPVKSDDFIQLIEKWFGQS